MLSASWLSLEGLEQSRSLGGGRLAADLAGSDRTLAVRAALAIGRTKNAAGVPLLLRCVRDRDVAMRAMCVYGLGLIADGRAIPAVSAALRDRAGAVQAAALDAIDRLQFAGRLDSSGQRRAEVLVNGLLLRGADTIRARAATTLESFRNGPQSSEAMTGLATAYSREKSGLVREHIMWSLFRGYAKDAPLKTIRAALNDRDEIVRIEAARAFGKRGDRAQAAALEPLLNDASWRVQEQARESLIVLRGGKYTEHLTMIPRFVHTPRPAGDPYASLRALPRPPRPAKLRPPSPAAVIAEPKLYPATLALFTGPAKGPHPRVRIATTQGNITLILFPEWAPLTVENFLNLANAGYYDGNPWFRIVPDFVVQSGDPSAASNGPGYTTVAEENPLEQSSYVIAMGLDYTKGPNAHAKRDSAGSEFYITLSPQFHLNRDFSVFGRMIGGFDVLGRLSERDKIVRVERLPDSAT